MASAHERLLDQYRKSVWRPSGADALRDDFPIVAEADHVYLTDAQGNRYIDGSASSGANIHGHRHPVIDAAIRTQLDRVADSPDQGATNVPAIQLAAQLAKLSPPSLEKVFFSPSATLAMEAALEAAAAVAGTEGNATVLFVREEGDESLESRVQRVRQPQGVELKPVRGPNCYRCPWGKEITSCARECIIELQTTVRKERATALVIEPKVHGRRGIVHPENYFRAARDVTRETGTLLIADETATAFGRSGKMFACQLEDGDPDLLVCAKGLTGGYMQLAATLVSKGVIEKLEQATPMRHVEPTHPANALACAAAIASLDLFEEEGTLGRVAVLASVAAKELDLIRPHPNIGEVRQQGLLIAIELVGDKENRTPFPRERKIGKALERKARELGVLVDVDRDTVLITPPLSIAQWELRTLIHKIREAIEGVTGATVDGAGSA